MKSRFIALTLSSLLLSAPVVRAAVTLYDAATGFTSVSTAPSPGHTFMGQALNLDATRFATNKSISIIRTAVANVSGVTQTGNLRLNVWFWQTYTPTAVSPTGVFSGQLGTLGSPTTIFDFGSVTLLNSNFSTVQADYSTPVTVNPTSGTTIGVTLNWQLDSGSGFVNVVGLTTPIHGGNGQLAPSVGSNATGIAPNFGYYRNVSGENDGNFLSGSQRNIGANSALYLQLEAVPELGTTSMVMLAGLIMLYRRRA